MRQEKRLKLRLFVVLASFPIAACTCDENLGQLEAKVEVEPKMLDFGMTPLDLTKQLDLTIRNKGTTRLTIERYSADPPFIAPAGTSTIGTFNSITARVGFRPTGLGPISGTLTLDTDDPDTPTVVVPLQGTGIEAAVKVEPPSVEFGEIVWVSGTAPETRMVTVSNPGSDAFDLTSIELSDAGGGVFTLDPMSVVRTFAPGDSATFAVEYTPNGRGAANGAVRIATTTRAAPEITVPLTASAVGPEMHICALAPGGQELCTQRGENPRIEFGNIDRNGMAMGTIRVLNVGERDLIIGNVFLTSMAPEFSFTPAVPSSGETVIADGSESTWTVTYTPQDYAFDAVIVGFASNSAMGSRSVLIQGGVKSARIRVVPRAATFSLSGAVTRAEQAVRIYNCGEEPLTIVGNVTLNQTGGPGPALSVSNAPPNGTTIPPQPSCEMGAPGAEFLIVFEPTSNGTYNAEVTIGSNDPTMPSVTVTVAATKT